MHLYIAFPFLALALSNPKNACCGKEMEVVL